MGLLCSIANRLQSIDRSLALARRRQKLPGLLQKNPAPHRLNIGSGKAPFAGWINLDLDPDPTVDLVWDITDGLPFPDGSCALIYSEHFLEHIPLPQAIAFLKECRRVLQPGGMVRVGMPLVAEPVRRYYENTWKEAPWLQKYGYTWIATRAEFINICFREWGHQWLYDEEELTRRLKEAGFLTVYPAEWGQSTEPALCGRETRRETFLICEAVRET